MSGFHSRATTAILAIVVATASANAIERNQSAAAQNISWWAEFVGEAMARKFGERTKAVDFVDPFDQACPRGTILISSAGDRVGLIIPQSGSGDIVEPGIPLMPHGPQNTPTFVFGREDCKYTITLKKFDAESEKEIPPAPVDRKAIDAQIEKDLRAGNRLTTPAPIESGSAIEPKPIRPYYNGVSRMGVDFDSAGPKLDLSGILFFGPWSVTLYVVNVPAEAVLESRRNSELKAYEIEFRNSVARLRLVITKEVNVGGLWVKAFTD
jgi:hypothetical protein